MRILITLIFCLFTLPSYAQDLPSWNEGPSKQQLIQFVKRVTDKSSKEYVAPGERIATFDNDGTLWVEQPIYTQVIFALDRIKMLAPTHPEWKNQAPFSTILSGDPEAIATLSLADLEKIVVVTHSGMSVSEFYSLVNTWKNTALNPHFKRPYTELVYQPMLEVMDYLRAHDFKVYIVTGGGQDFVRSFSQSVYKVEQSSVIGTSGKTTFKIINNKPELIKLAEVLLIDDKEGKPEAINLFIAKKPIIAFGNSDGDKQMLEWTQSNPLPHLMFLVHHDDAKREYAYDSKSKVGTFSDALMEEAKQHKWNIISMKNEWKVIFPFEKKRVS